MPNLVYSICFDQGGCPIKLSDQVDAATEYGYSFHSPGLHRVFRLKVCAVARTGRSRGLAARWGAEHGGADGTLRIGQAEARLAARVHGSGVRVEDDASPYV